LHLECVFIERLYVSSLEGPAFSFHLSQRERELAWASGNSRISFVLSLGIPSCLNGSPLLEERARERYYALLIGALVSSMYQLKRWSVHVLDPG